MCQALAQPAHAGRWTLARIYQRSGIWYLDYAVAGKRVRRAAGTSRKVADLALKDIEVQMAKGEFGLLPVPVALPNHTAQEQQCAG